MARKSLRSSQNSLGKLLYFLNQTTLDTVQTYLRARDLSSPKMQLIIL